MLSQAGNSSTMLSKLNSRITVAWLIPLDPSIYNSTNYNREKRESTPTRQNFFLGNQKSYLEEELQHINVDHHIPRLQINQRSCESLANANEAGEKSDHAIWVKPNWHGNMTPDTQFFIIINKGFYILGYNNLFKRFRAFIYVLNLLIYHAAIWSYFAIAIPCI